MSCAIRASRLCIGSSARTCSSPCPNGTARSIYCADVHFVVMARPGWAIDWDALPPEFRHLKDHVVAVPPDRHQQHGHPPPRSAEVADRPPGPRRGRSIHRRAAALSGLMGLSRRADNNLQPLFGVRRPEKPAPQAREIGPSGPMIPKACLKTSAVCRQTFRPRCRREASSSSRTIAPRSAGSLGRART